MDVPILDPERQKQAKVYARIRRRLALAGMVLAGTYTLLWLVAGWANDLSTTIARLTSNPWLAVAIFAAVFGGLQFLVSLPLDFYTGFTLPHRFGQSNQTLKGWFSDQVKGMLVGVPLGLALVELIYALLRAAPEAWWLWVAGVMIAFNVLMANLGPVLIMPLFNKFVPLDQEHQDLAERLIRLAKRAGTQVRGVFKFDMSRRTKSANAALTGLGNTRRIILGDTLIDEFSPDEIETILAHELGHHAHRDIALGILAESAFTLVGLFLASLVLKQGSTWMGLSTPADPASMPLLVLAMGVFGLVTMPLGNTFSRWRERRADQYALELTSNGAAFANAFTRLANQNLSEVDPEKWVVWLFYSHPPLRDRIAMAQAGSTDYTDFYEESV